MWSVHHTLSLLLLAPQDRTPHTPAWGPSHQRQSSTSFYNASPSHRLQLLMNCPSVGPSHGVQSFGNRLLQHGSPAGSHPPSGTSTCSGVGSSTSFFTDLGVCRVVSLMKSHSSLWLQLLLHRFVFPLLKYFVTEELPLMLMGSALARDRSILEPVGIGSIGHGGSFSQLLTEATPVAHPAS